MARSTHRGGRVFPDMNVRYAVRPGAATTSEDVVILAHGAVVLLDGARSVVPQRRSGGWYAEHLALRIVERLNKMPDRELTDVLADAIAALAEEFQLVPSQSPSSTVAIARWGQQTVDLLVLGDSPIVWREVTGKIGSLRDDRLASVAPFQNEACRGYLRHGGGYDRFHLQLIGELQRTERRYRNRAGGYWICEALPEAARHARVRTLDRSQVSSVLLASDGLSTAVDEGWEGLAWTTVADLAAEPGPTAVLELVEELELRDPHGRAWPRHKPHDDKALAALFLH